MGQSRGLARPQVTGTRSRNEASCGGEDEDLERWEDRALFVEDVIYYTLSWARPRQPFTNGLTRIPCVVGTMAGTDGNAGCRLPLTLGLCQLARRRIMSTCGQHHTIKNAKKPAEDMFLCPRGSTLCNLTIFNDLLAGGPTTELHPY
ncbi:hypothetical protein BDFB_012035 [Asbolus verrucosus]|uniref:Uncharacterized protein n=1 Tax=Asbolus verrucosus TaxID=1661398 RepID=A0A482W760_ASBVE|nr:hypothetical protein BDFB_012035 [Asbolus verrucosus]